MPDPRIRWDAENTIQIKLKLNRRTDADILEWLDAKPNKQGAIKELIRAQMMKGEPEMIDIKYFDSAVQLMDDELREEIHADLSPCSDEEFLREYERRHYLKFGEEFKN